ncbi:hypothetical protein E8E12_001279 [Didymella heteroderae]|uniref:Carboxylic ester hydrolase n=1 Tax=Didymella heteroderae TaxID=1769908 RepID=A0A9P4WLL1_9PLEO|nr:hypothetical protein E8E12_001279 [Didymella heteroderae]
MSLSPFLSNCSTQAIPFPAIFGSKFLTVETSLVLSLSLSSLVDPSQLYRDDGFGDNMSFCNVTLTHTHPNQNDRVTTQVWLPVQPEWNGRLKMVGGAGLIAGLGLTTDVRMPAAVADGYATVATDAGAPTDNTVDWLLLSPGNLNMLALQNFAYVALQDAALAAKSVVKSFFGQSPLFSYFDGCSQGGRQGYAFAQRYPNVFNGIHAAAPAINAEVWAAEYFPQQVMNELKEYPYPCEIDALTNLAIKACDGNDGVLDGIISNEDSCAFDPYTAVGAELQCSSPGAPKNISRAAAIIADAAWNGARRADGTFLFPTVGHQANLTGYGGLAETVCTGNGTCTGVVNDLLYVIIALFVEKNPNFDLASMTRRDFEQAFRRVKVEFDTAMGTASPDLYDFKFSGGKMLTYHGLADEVITFRGTRLYYDRVAAIDPDVHGFYRLFEAPGIAHCGGGIGGYPARSFEALVKWVEEGVTPDALEAIDVANRTSLLCPYPKRGIFTGAGMKYSADDFVCE